MPTIHRRAAAAPPRLERRVFTLRQPEWRDPGEGSADFATLRGYAAVFDRDSLPLYDWWFGEYLEEIDPAAFDRVLSERPDVHLNYMHDMASAMARTANGSLKLTPDPIGVRVWAKLDPEDLDVQRVGPKMRNGIVDQMSFAFTVALDADGEARERWTFEGDQARRRILEIGELFDVTIVPQGAYPQTEAELNARQRELRGRIAEAREGKVLSASSRSAIQRAIEELQSLLDTATTENGRAAAQRFTELRADMPSLEALVAMHQWGQEFIACENEPDDGPDRDAMGEVLDQIESLIAVEATEPADGSTGTGRGRSVDSGDRSEEARGVDSPEPETIAPSDSADGEKASPAMLLRLRRHSSSVAR